MSQPVKLSDEIVLDARLIGAISQRSIAGQIEFWAQLGEAIERLLDGARALALRQADGTKPLSEILASVDTDERRSRVASFLESRPFPHYEPAKDSPGLLVRIEENGTRSLGRIVGREFRVIE